MTRWALLWLAALTVGVGACAREMHNPADTARLDSIFAEWNRPDSPGCGVGVSRDGRVVYERGYGMADIERRVPIGADSVFPLASLSKPFTAMSILLLAQQKRLSLDDEVRHYVPEWRYRQHPITIRQLLTHTGGLRDVFLLEQLASPVSPRGDVNEKLLGLLAQQRGMNFVPGTEVQYSNGGYNVLGGIVRRVSGQPLRAFAEANIFRSLGMTATHVHDDPARTIPNRVSSYTNDGDGFKSVCAECSGIVGNAGMFSTVRDLLRWAQNLAEPRVGDSTLIAAMQTPATPAGPMGQWSHGLQVGDHGGRRTVGHAGGDRGIATNLTRYLAEGLAIVVLCNTNAPAVELTRRVADVYLEPGAESTGHSPGSVSAAVTLSPAALASKTGRYGDAEAAAADALVDVVVENGQLVAVLGSGDRMPLAPASAERFTIPGLPVAVTFLPGPNGRPRAMEIVGVAATPAVLPRVEPFTPEDRDLRAAAGSYANVDLDVTYTLVPGGGTLILQRSGREDVRLAPLFRDTFEGFNIVRFARDGRGAVTGFDYHSTGVRRLRFDRVGR